MTKQFDQLEIFTKMIKALDSGNHTQIKKADKLIRKALSENKKRDMHRSVFSFSTDEAIFFNNLHEESKLMNSRSKNPG